MTNDPERPRKVAAVLQSSLGVMWACGCFVLALIGAGILLWIATAYHQSH